jgi:O-antigen/teichoic acid export membrane protein
MVGVYALLRVLPGLVGVMAAAGLPTAVPYFLAGARSEDRRLPFTICLMALGGGALGTVVWVAGSFVAGATLFPHVSPPLVLTAGVMVATQISIVTAKSCSQGSGDMPGANRVIFTEQFLFLPVYCILWAAGLDGYSLLVAAALLADVATLLLGWARLLQRGFFSLAGPPSLGLARDIAAYGLRAQVGGMMSMLNLRLDFVLLGIMTTPTVLGVYAVASKYAELIKIPTVALAYVLYPKYARDGEARATETVRRTLPKAGMASMGAVIPLWLASMVVIPTLYGSDFTGAVIPAQIILVGFALEGVAGVLTGYFYGIGRPGLNSAATAVGLLTTLLLDLMLIPRYQETGAAVASACAYSATTLSLIWFFTWLSRRPASSVRWRGRALADEDIAR